MNLFLSRFKEPYRFIIFLLLLIGNSSLIAKQLPVEVNLIWEQNFFDVAPVDLDGDTIDELVIIGNDNTIQPHDQSLNAVIATRQVNRQTFKKGNSIAGGFDDKRIWVTYFRNDSLFLYDILPRREIFVIKGRDIAEPKGWDGVASQCELIDINADGRLEAIVRVGTGWDLEPRGVFALDWETGKLLWRFLSGPFLNTLSLRDIDKDGKTEILCGTFASGNGNIENGTDDMHTYVFLINFDGKLRWKKQIGIYSSYAEILWLDEPNTNHLQILVVENGNPAGNREHDSLFILDGLNGEIINRAQYGKFNRGFGIIRDGKNQSLIVVGNSDDTLRMFDSELHLVRKCSMHGSGAPQFIETGSLCPGKFSGGRQNELAIATINGLISIYTMKLKLICQFPAGNVASMKPVKLKNKSRLLVRVGSFEQGVWRLYEFNTIPVLSRRVTVATALWGALILLLGFGIVLTYTRYRQTRDIRTVIRRLTGQAGVIELNRKGEMISANSKAREIISKLNRSPDKLPITGPLAPIVESAKAMAKEPEAATFQETVISISPEQTFLVRCVPVKRGALITFEDISMVEYLKRVTAWAPVAQKLAHGIKTPLQNIRLTIQQLETTGEPEKEKSKELFDGVKSDLKRVIKLTDSFMRFTQLAPLNLAPENINNILKGLGEKYEFSIPERIKIEYDLAEDIPEIMVDKKELINAFSIVMDNAIDAMEEKGTGSREQGAGISEQETGIRKRKEGILIIRTLRTEKMEKEGLKEYVRIEIADTGKGIPEQYLNELFKPYFTYEKPEGTGLGLTLAKRIIENHNGTIEITSKENIGTTVSINLPIK